MPGMWPWRRERRDEAERERLAAAKREAAQAVADAQARWPEVNETARRTHERVSRNHIGALVDEALRARPRAAGDGR